jgi:uncharacterized membrane protein YhaH (DUF805 family)
MDGAWLARWRWRTRGAWLWPTFVVITAVDGLIVHSRPLSGSSQTVVGGIVFGLVANLIAVIVLSWPLGLLVRRLRSDMPVGVARNYAGTFALLIVTAGMVAIGFAHHSTVVSEQRTLDDAVTRAMAYIGARAPAPFRVNVEHTDTFTIQPGIYRTCVPNRAGTRTYCVIVNTQRPFAHSVFFSGYEPNSLFSEGAS